MSKDDINPKLKEGLYKDSSTGEDSNKETILQQMIREQQSKAGILPISDVRERLLQILEEAKEPTVGAGRTEYTIDGWRLHDLIKGFANAL